MININEYPRAAELVKDCDMEDMVDQIRWTHLNKTEAAVSLAKLYLISTMSTSNSIPAREKAKKLTIQSYFSAGYRLHAFAKEEGRNQLGLDNEDVVRLFKNVELGGRRYQ